MPADQFNVRLRWGLDRQVRMKAAELGVKPRDIIEDALEMAGFTKLSESGDPGPNQLRLSMPERADIAPTGGRPQGRSPKGAKTDAAHRDEDRPRGRESGDQRAAEPRTPRQRSGRKDRGDKAGEARKSGAAGSGGQLPVDAPGQSRGCRECGGNLVNDTCEECGARWATEA